jgi:microcystin-dependent protein
MGTIIAFALDQGNIPDRWLLCDGSAISPADYQELITALGSSNTPNLVGRTLIGASDDWPLNSTGGEPQHLLTVDEMPSHNHSLQYQFGLDSDCHSGSGSTPCQDSSQTNLTNMTGGSAPHNNMQPYYAINYIIYGGSAPTRK